MGEQWYKRWLSIMKKKAKFKTQYVEPVYPAEFRTSVHTFEEHYFLPGVSPKVVYLPAIMTGWVQDEVHIQWGYQSLQ